jgi:Concanavalin A-like lectin/glucanases superfamily/CHU_C Type IX secretion signal domain
LYIIGISPKSYINVGHKSNLNLAKTSFTISAWVNLDSFSTSNGSTIISNRTNIAKDSGWIFDIGGYNGKHVRKVILGSCCNNAAFSDDLTLQEWHHIIVLYNYDSQTSRFYFNNKFVSTSYFSGNNFLHFGNDTLVDHTIGREINNQFSGGNNYALNGKLDDIGIWNRELSDLELKNLCESCTLAITVMPINKSITIPDTTYLTVKTNDSAATYQWQIFNGTDFENIYNNENYFGTNSNTLRVNFSQFSIDYLEYRCIIQHGNCTIVSDKIALTIQKNFESPEFQMPKAFTPNNDGLNDNLVPVMKNSIILEYKIFNTYGELIFATSNLNEKSPRNQYWMVHIKTWMLPVEFIFF